MHAEGQSAFEVKVKYTTTDDAVFTDPCAETPDGVTCTQSAFDNDRYFASSTSAPFYFYDNPVVNEVRLSTNAELIPGRPLFSDAGAGRRRSLPRPAT